MAAPQPAPRIDVFKNNQKNANTVRVPASVKNLNKQMAQTMGGIVRKK